MSIKIELNNKVVYKIPYKEVYNEIPQLIAVISMEGVVLDANDAVVKLSGVSKEALIGQPYWELPCWVHSLEMQNRIMFSMEESAVTGKSVRFEAQYKDYQEQLNDVDLSIKAVYGNQENVQYYVASGYNVTELVSARKSLTERERQMHALFEYSAEGYFFNVLPEHLNYSGEADKLDAIINDSIRYQKIVRINGALKQILMGNADEEALSDKVYKLLNISGRQYRHCMAMLLEQGEYKFEHTLTAKDGQVRILEIYLVIIRSEHEVYGNFGVVRDLTKQRQYERELEFFANKDLLTGLNNRRTFFKYARTYFNEGHRHGMVCMFDIDHFKKVNDNYGHDMGDQVLKQVAALTERHFEASACACRYGGEEFAVIFTETQKEEAFARCEDFRIALSQIEFITPEDVHFRITVSLGLAEISEADDAVDQTISRSDKALYYSKNHGRNQTTLFTEAIVQ